MTKLRKRNHKEDILPTEGFTRCPFEIELLQSLLLEDKKVACLSSSQSELFLLSTYIQEVAIKLKNKDGCHIICVVANVEEVYDVLSNQSNLNTIVLEEEMPKDFEVLITSAKRLLDVIESKQLVGEISVVVVSDAHLVIDQQSQLSQLMKKIHLTNKDAHLVGITSSLLPDQPKSGDDLQLHINRLEAVFGGKIVVAGDLTANVSEGGARLELLNSKTCSDDTDNTGLFAVMEQLIIPTLRAIEDIDVELNTGETDARVAARFALTEVWVCLVELGPFAAYRISDAMYPKLEKLADVEGNELLSCIYATAASALRSCSITYEEYERELCNVDMFMECHSPKVRELCEILRRYKPQDFGLRFHQVDDMSDDSFDSADDEEDDKHQQSAQRVSMVPVETEESSAPLPLLEDKARLSGLVFVNRKHLAFALDKTLQEICKWDEDLFFVKSAHITAHGQQTAEAEKVRRRQNEDLQRFRDRELNLMCSTAVLEAGIELPQCNLVISYNPVTSYSSYVKTKTKASLVPSTFVCFSESADSGAQSNLSIFGDVEEVLKRYVVDTITLEPTLEPIVVTEADLSPLSFSFTDIVINLENAISFINIYCARLPSDSFTSLVPRCEVKKSISGLYTACLVLPINSPCRVPIVGPATESRLQSLQAVALITCRKLADMGELNDQLCESSTPEPPQIEIDEELLEETEQSRNRPGSIKRKQYYYKSVASALTKCKPAANTPCLLYELRMRLVVPVTDEQNPHQREIYKPEQAPRAFALLTSKPIPKVPDFAVYTRAGEEEVSLELITESLSLTEDQFKLVSKFHRNMFWKVLRLEKTELINFDLDNSPVPLLCVPINDSDAGGREIDWPFIKKVCDGIEKPVRRDLSDSDREAFEFDASLWSDAVVYPAYRNVDSPQYYYVEDITDLTPMSKFPSQESFSTYKEYFTRKYKVTITNNKQPMLDVDHTSARFNMLTPRYLNPRGVPLPAAKPSKEKGRDEKQQLFVPELCYVHPVPASIWRKIVTIPTILFRLNSLLVAEELRCRIAREAHIGIESLPQEYQWDRLIFEYPVIDQQDEEDSKAIEQLNAGVEAMDLKADEKNCTDDSNSAASGSQTMPAQEATIVTASGDSVENEKTEKKEEKGGKTLLGLGSRCHVSFSSSPDPNSYYGPSPCMLLQTLTLSNANDFFSLERLETVGDSFLKYAITTYLYVQYPYQHEGKLSALRSCLVSNFNLYRLGRLKLLPEIMIGSKFEPGENWLPPGYAINTESKRAVTQVQNASLCVPGMKLAPGVTGVNLDPEVVDQLQAPEDRWTSPLTQYKQSYLSDESAIDIEAKEVHRNFRRHLRMLRDRREHDKHDVKRNSQGPNLPCYLQTQHLLPDKSVADVVESMLGCYLVSGGEKAACELLHWFGIPAITSHRTELLRNPLISGDHEAQLNELLVDYNVFERDVLGYTFKNKAYLLQAVTHASYHPNALTDCYQRLEFLGDAVLDYVITRHLFEDPKKHNPGTLTDLRSALVNNNMFAGLALQHNFHKFFRFISPQLFDVVKTYITWCTESGHDLYDPMGDLDSEALDTDVEDIEVPKALGDIFESVAGAVYLDSGCSLDVIWNVYYKLMKEPLDAFTENIPKSPIRELLEREPEKAKFEKPERTMDGKVQVVVNLIGRTQFTGEGRCFRIAKSAAARRALRYLRLSEQLVE